MPDLPTQALSADDVRKVAKLARLRLTDEQVEAERARLASVLSLMDSLRSLPLDGVEPMAHVADEQAEHRDILRDDEPGPTLHADTVADLAPDSQTFPSPHADPNSESPTPDETYIRVPRVLGGSQSE